MKRVSSLAILVALLGTWASAYASLTGWLFGPVSAVQTWFGATLPTAPATFSTTMPASLSCSNTNHGSCYTPADGPTLQTDLNAAAAATGSLGDIIELAAGSTYTSASCFTLPARSGSGWIYLISTDAPELGGGALPAQGTRVGPSNIIDMASLRSSSSSNSPVLCAAASASYYRLVGLDVELVDANGTTNYAIDWDNGSTSLTTLANNIVIDRCYVSGAPSYGVRHAVDLDGERMGIIESYVTGAFQVGDADTNAIFVYNSIGPYRVNDNYLSAIGETTFFGGAATTLPSPSQPSDITITNNHFYKDYPQGTGSVTSGSTTLTISSLSSGSFGPMIVPEDANGCIPSGDYITAQTSGTTGGSGTYTLNVAATCSSTRPPVAINGVPNGKNMIEFKEGQRVLVDSNYFENAGAMLQPRSAFTWTASNYSPNNWMQLLDYTITNNVFTNMEFGGINLLLQANVSQDGENTAAAYRILFRNDIFLMSTNDGSEDTTMLGIFSNLPNSSTGGGGTGGDVIFDHCTFVNVTTNGANSIFYMGNGADLGLDNVVFSNVIFDKSQYGIGANGSPSNWGAAVPPQCTDCNMINTVLVGSTDSSIPSGNFKPANDSAVDFTSYGSVVSPAGYALTSSSPYYKAGVSGANLGYNSPGTPDGTDIGANIVQLPTS